ncbi:hypothetical protein D3C80_271740 [compost metagenome]
MQLVDQFIEVEHRVVGLIGQQGAAGLVHVAIALCCAQGKHIARVAGARVDQLAQVVQVGGLQGLQFCHRQGRAGADVGREGGFTLTAVGDKTKRGGGQVGPAQCRQQQPEQGQSPDFSMPALAESAPQRP